jgi:hypothetical protein
MLSMRKDESEFLDEVCLFKIRQKLKEKAEIISFRDVDGVLTYYYIVNSKKQGADSEIYSGFQSVCSLHWTALQVTVIIEKVIIMK